MSDKNIVLIHGYFKTYRDMRQLKKYLIDLGYKVFSADLPLTFYEIDRGVEKFTEYIRDIIGEIGENQKLSLVGHSTGGLVIRKFILNNPDLLENIDNCVLIATPNKGNEIAEFAVEKLKIFPRVFRTINSLQPKVAEKIEPLVDIPMRIGAIAGDREDILTNPFFDCENDGRVSIDSVKCNDLDDFIILPYHHKVIHKQKDTAKYVSNFIEHGSFRI